MRSLCDELLERVRLALFDHCCHLFLSPSRAFRGARCVHRERHAGGVYLGHDAKQVGGAPCVAGAVYYGVPLHTKLVKAVVVYPLVV